MSQLTPNQAHSLDLAQAAVCREFFAEYTRQAASLPGHSITELEQLGAKEGDIITAAVTFSWVTKGERYKIGKTVVNDCELLQRDSDSSEWEHKGLHSGKGIKTWEATFERDT